MPSQGTQTALPMQHPLHLFSYCPKCGSDKFAVNDFKSKRCGHCGFVYYFNPLAATVGIITNDKGEVLVARRAKEPAKGTLDLPGGFCDSYETAEEGVVREIEEETGVKARVLRPLCDTTHAYYFPRTERWELKCTHWYLLRSTDSGDLKPQTEEGIVGVEWCNPIEVDRYLAESYPTIRRVVEALRSVVRR